MMLIRRCLAIVFIFVFVWVAIEFLNREKPTYNILKFESVERIIDTGQFFLTPTLEYKGGQGYLSVELVLNAFQEPRLLTMDYKNQLYLEINDHPVSIVPLVTFKERTNYKLTMDFTFDLGVIQDIKDIKLTVFTFSDNEFIWSI